MQRSEERILTTHVGSLPRSPEFTDLILQRERDEHFDTAEFEREAGKAIAHVVDAQVEAGIDVINDGEQPRPSFSTYVYQRMQGFGGVSERPVLRDMDEYQDYAELVVARLKNTAKMMDAPQAIADVSYEDLSEAQRECDLFGAASEARSGRFVERFMSAASPGIISTTLINAHYPSHEEYVFALAREMKKEYEFVTSQGYLLQIDCPDLAMEWSFALKDITLDDFRRTAAMHIEAINVATENIPADRIRLHVCWGNYDGPHVYDIALEEILTTIYEANVGALSLGFANPRHQHEMAVIKANPPPDDMLFLPGVIDSTTNYVEHPEVVAQRIEAAVDAVGDRTSVIASTDCGFGTFAGWQMVAETVVWEKLRALQEGAAIASQRLWS
jgi:5-methyltetrahydropteroyltriglutamate--homocysteine methyltransferase